MSNNNYFEEIRNKIRDYEIQSEELQKSVYLIREIISMH